MPRRWRGVLDLVAETDKVLAELNRTVGELANGDPLDRTRAAHRIKVLAANARTANDAVRFSLERHDEMTPS